LGRTFHGESLLSEQEEAVDRLVGLAVDADVDLVVIAGDLYDRAIPPADAVGLFDEALVRLHGTGARVVAIAGNHDSANRVAVGDKILEQAGVTVRGAVSRCVEPLRFDPGDGGPIVAVYPVPFLEPSLAGPALSRFDDSVDSEGSRRFGHDEVTKRATALIGRHALSGGPSRTVVVAHTFVCGGTATDSERDLSVGNVDLVEVSAFDGFDYVALGHLHRDQAFDGGRVAYSGTPLAYSFSEECDIKSARIVELDAGGRCRSEVVPLGVGRPLRTLRGKLEELLARAEFADAEEARVRVELTDPELPLQAMPRLQTRFPHAVVLEHEPEGRAAPGGGAVSDAVRSAASPFDLAVRFWVDQHGATPSEAQAGVIADALAAAGSESEG
jgi:exonuclease SbcD